MVRRAKTDRGIALFTVIWIGLLISAIVVGFTRDTRTGVQIAQNETAAVEAHLAAESAVTYAALVVGAQMRGLSLAEEPPTGVARGPGQTVFDPRRPVAIDGRAYNWRTGRSTVTLRIQSEEGKYSLNSGNPDFLSVLLQRAGIRNADEVAAGILALRARDGRTLGISWRLNDRGIEQIVDLTRIEALSTDDFDRLAPLVTVRSDREFPDPLTATDLVFRALPLNEEQRRRMIDQRNRVPKLPEENLTLTISAEAVLDGGGKAARRALVEIAPDRTRPVRIIGWLRP